MPFQARSPMFTGTQIYVMAAFVAVAAAQTATFNAATHEEPLPKAAVSGLSIKASAHNASSNLYYVAETIQDAEVRLSTAFDMRPLPAVVS